MSLSIGVGGANKTVAAVSIGVGGAWKSVASAWIGVGGAWKQFLSSSKLDTTLTEGTDTDGGTVAYGYDAGGYSGPWGAFGSMSDTSLDGGGTVLSVYDLDTGYCGFVVSIGPDPGINFFTTITVGGVQKTASSASYFYSGGAGYWSWSGNFGMDGSGSSTVVVV